MWKSHGFRFGKRSPSTWDLRTHALRAPVPPQNSGPQGEIRWSSAEDVFCRKKRTNEKRPTGKIIMYNIYIYYIYILYIYYIYYIYIILYIYSQTLCFAVAKIVICHFRKLHFVQAKHVCCYCHSEKMHFNLRPPMNLSTCILRGRRGVFAMVVKM